MRRELRTWRQLVRIHSASMLSSSRSTSHGVGVDLCRATSIWRLLRLWPNWRLMCLQHSRRQQQQPTASDSLVSFCLCHLLTTDSIGRRNLESSSSAVYPFVHTSLCLCLFL